jgi:hypothetical protein
MVVPTTRDRRGPTNKWWRAEGEFAALLVAGVGQEPRLGRWLKVNTGGAKNCALVVPLRVTKS